MNTDRLYLRYAVNDLVKNRAITIALLVLLVLSASLMATGALVMERLLGSVDRLFDEAKPPHFLQMNSGDYDTAALTAFAEGRPEIASWLIEDMVGFDSVRLTWRRPSTGASGDLSSSLVDNLFVTQNDTFDFLLDAAGAVPRPAEGELYVPIAYQQRFGLTTGDELGIRTDAGTRILRVAGVVRDAQMASSLSSATRLLVSEADFAALADAGGGTREIIVEYRLTDAALAADFATAYERAPGLPKNGQAVTFQMIRLINVFSDGLVAVALIFVSVLLIVIALLNLRFVIRGTIEDDVRSIGVMKAIGLPNRSISGLYLSKYSVLTLVACVVGGLLAVPTADLLTAGARVSYSPPPVGPATVLVPVLALALVFAVVVGICGSVLRGVRRIAVVNALVHGSTLDERQTAAQARRLARRARSRRLESRPDADLNRRMALIDLRVDARQWVLVPLVFLLSALVIALPTNLLSTLSSPRFVTYMGAPASDLRADIQFTDDMDAVRTAFVAALASDARLRNVRSYAETLAEASGPEGWQTLHVEVGDYADATVAFLRGTAPGEGQIALSVLNASRYGVAVGDPLTLRVGGVERRLTVSGIYQDVTSGGYTAKMQGAVTSDAAGYVIYADAPGADAGAVARDYASRFPKVTVIAMQSYVAQTLSYVTDALRSATVLAFVFGAGVAGLITALFLRLRLTRERRRRGVLSVVGFSTREIVSQIRLKAAIAVVAGTLLGVVVAATLGQTLVGSLLGLLGLGIVDLTFIPNPLLAYLACPAALLAAGAVATLLITFPLYGVDKSSWLEG